LNFTSIVTVVGRDDDIDAAAGAVDARASPTDCDEAGTWLVHDGDVCLREG